MKFRLTHPQPLIKFLSGLVPRLGNELAALEGVLQIEIKTVSGRQTDEQRGYYWQSLHYWGDQAGYSHKETENWLHNAVCCEAFGVVGRKQIGGSLIEVPKMTSSRLGVTEYSKLIETMLRLAAEGDVYIPEPTI